MILSMRRQMPQGHQLAGCRRCAAATAFLLAAANCAPQPPMSSAAIPSIVSGAARLWFYRDYEPYETLARPYVRLNEQVAGISEPGGVFYRDLRPASLFDHR
jgi:hypothetical protein